MFWHMFINFELIIIYANNSIWILEKLRVAELLKNFSTLYETHIQNAHKSLS